MDDLNEKISQEKSYYQKMKKNTYRIGAIFILVGIGFGLVLSQGEGLAPVGGGIVLALYLAFGVSILVKNIGLSQEEKNAIRSLRIEHQVNEIYKKLNKTDTESS